MKTKLTAVLLMASAVLAQDDHHGAVEKRGDHVMGFSHEKSTHHFRLFADGGAIEVTANDPKDTDTAIKSGCTYPISRGCSPREISGRRY